MSDTYGVGLASASTALLTQQENDTGYYGPAGSTYYPGSAGSGGWTMTVPGTAGSLLPGAVSTSSNAASPGSASSGFGLTTPGGTAIQSFTPPAPGSKSAGGLDGTPIGYAVQIGAGLLALILIGLGVAAIALKDSPQGVITKAGAALLA